MDSYKQYQEKRIAEIKADDPSLPRTEIIEWTDMEREYTQDYLPTFDKIEDFRIAYWLKDFFGYQAFWRYLRAKDIELDQHVWDLVVDKQQREHPNANIR